MLYFRNKSLFGRVTLTANCCNLRQDRAQTQISDRHFEVARRKVRNQNRGVVGLGGGEFLVSHVIILPRKHSWNVQVRICVQKLETQFCILRYKHIDQLTDYHSKLICMPLSPWPLQEPYKSRHRWRCRIKCSKKQCFLVKRVKISGEHN